MKIGFVMDPIEQVNINADTTFAFMVAAAQRGHEIYYIPMQSLRVQSGRVHALLTPCAVRREVGRHYEPLAASSWEPLGDMDVVFMRKDPPFDVAYLHATHYLQLVEQEGTLVVNKPRGLQLANEKLFALNFPDALPQTIVSAQADHILDFVSQVGGRAILKPIDGHGGEGIFMLESGNRNNNAIVETMTRSGREQVMCQAYIPEARAGDKRIIMLDGIALGGIMRVPQENDHRGNIHVGGTVQRADLTPRDMEICAMVGPRLREEGLWFVGLDVIGEYLTEINVTSPTGIQEMSRLNDVDGAGEVIAWAETMRG